MILVKEKEGVVAVCDSSLYDKTLNNGAISFKVSKPFFGGEEVADKDKFREILADATNVNMIGEVAVSWARELGFVKEENIKYIDNVPHAIIIQIDKKTW